ncbi:hypothetical protein [Halochromatium roseum]|nr:hypothetical protein [Halochromatium roseum]
MTTNVDVAIIGAGHAGLNVVNEVRKVTDRWILITWRRLTPSPSSA